MREVYRREKKRIRFSRLGYLVLYWCLYLMKMLGNVPSPYSVGYEERADIVLSFNGSWLIFIGIFLLFATNDNLFFIQEQGKRIYVLEKYAIVPIHKKKLYNVRIWLFLETIFYSVIGACVIYTIVTIANGCAFSPYILFLSAIKLLGILVLLMILILVFESRSQGKMLQKK